MGLVSDNTETWLALRTMYDSMAMLPGAEDYFLACETAGGKYHSPSGVCQLPRT